MIFDIELPNLDFPLLQKATFCKVFASVGNHNLILSKQCNIFSSAKLISTFSSSFFSLWNEKSARYSEPLKGDNGIQARQDFEGPSRFKEPEKFE